MGLGSGSRLNCYSVGLDWARLSFFSIFGLFIFWGLSLGYGWGSGSALRQGCYSVDWIRFGKLYFIFGGQCWGLGKGWDKIF